MSKELKRNKRRVFEIYGIPKRERHNYQMHHIIFRSEGGGDIKSNLYPLRPIQHKELHDKIRDMES